MKNCNKGTICRKTLRFAGYFDFSIFAKNIPGAGASLNGCLNETHPIIRQKYIKHGSELGLLVPAPAAASVFFSKTP